MTCFWNPIRSACRARCSSTCTGIQCASCNPSTISEVGTKVYRRLNPGAGPSAKTLGADCFRVAGLKAWALKFVMVFKRISLPVCRSSPVMLGLRFCVSPKPALCGRFGFGVSWRRLSPEEKASAEGKPSETERVLRRPPTRIVATFENAKQRGGWREVVSCWKRSGYPRAGLSPLNTENRKYGFLCDLTTSGIEPVHLQFWVFLTH